MYTDAEAALDFLLENGTVNNKDIFVFGRSIGGAVAIELARRRSDEVRSSGPFGTGLMMRFGHPVGLSLITVSLAGCLRHC